MHLTDQPRHMKRFVKQQYNTVVASASKGGDRKCWTCAASFTNLEKLNRHLDLRGHRRHGIIPRFVADNGRHDQMHQRGLMRSFHKYPYMIFESELIVDDETMIKACHIRHAVGYEADEILPSDELIKEESDRSEDTSDPSDWI